MRHTVFTPSDKVSVSILAGQSLSAAVDLGGLRLAAMGLSTNPSGSVLTFQASLDGGATWIDIYDDFAGEYTVPTGPSRYLSLDMAIFEGVTLLRVRAGTASAPQAQVVDCGMTLVLVGG